MKNQNKITEDEIIESLTRSGYLLESEITKRLSDLDFFVESNISSLDPLTGKGREIDLVAEYKHNFPEERKEVAIVRFVFEIKNNDWPLVLMTKFESSPNSELYNGLKIGETIPKNISPTSYGNFYEVLYDFDPQNLFTQYCSFSKKKNEELMALHPETMYSALLKITHFCEESIEPWNNEQREYKDDYLRSFLYLPVLLINDDLYELEITEDNKNQLKKVECSKLVFNYHYKQEPQTSIVYIITKAGLEDFLKEMLRAEREVEEGMVKARKSLKNKTNAIQKPESS